MTTDNGFPQNPKTIRAHINVLKERRDYLQEVKLPSVLAERPDLEGKATWQGSEIAALDYAIDVLEAEWDTAARIARNLKEIRILMTRTTSPETRTLTWEGPECDAKDPC